MGGPSGRIAPVLFVALALCGGGALSQNVPPSGPPQGSRTAMIVGQVVDATGSPVPEAIVHLSMRNYQAEGAGSPNGRVMADRDGRFFFDMLPPGEFYLRAVKEGYQGGGPGQRRAMGPDRLLRLADGERRTDILLTLWKHAVISGSVVDEAGEPVVGVGVRGLGRDFVGGRERFGNRQVRAELVPTAVTDDRGMFRLSQLVPGTYVVVVPSTQTTLPTGLVDSAKDPALSRELFFGGITEVAPLGDPRIQQAGDFALLTLTRLLIPPPSDPGGRMAVYPTTYFPSASTAFAAAQIAVESGEERAGLTITLTPVAAARVSGRLVTPDGSPPPPMTIKLAGEAAAGVIDSGSINGLGHETAKFETATGVSDADGRFMLLGVPPGEYVLRHGSRSLSTVVTGGRRGYWFSEGITVGTSDLAGLTIALRPALRVEGKIVFRAAGGGASPSLPAFAGITFETPFGEPGQFAVSTRERDGWTFATFAAGGRYIARALESSGWFVQSITLDGKDITDRAFDLQADATSFVVTYTDRPLTVTGIVKDASGAPRADAIALAFPMDPERWSGYGTSPRILRRVLTSEAGVYTFDNLPAGRYYVVAIDGADPDAWKDPKVLEALAGVAERVTIDAADPSAKSIDLTVKAIR